MTEKIKPDPGFVQVPGKDYAIRRWANFGMEYIDPKHVICRHPETDAPLVAINREDGKISIDPRYIDEEAFFADIQKILDRSKNEGSAGKGFG